jgi:hypothetical protein
MVLRLVVMALALLCAGCAAERGPFERFYTASVRSINKVASWEED